MVVIASLGGVASAVPTTSARIATPSAPSSITLLIVVFLSLFSLHLRASLSILARPTGLTTNASTPIAPTSHKEGWNYQPRHVRCTTRHKYERIQNSALHPFGVCLALLERYLLFRTSENSCSTTFVNKGKRKGPEPYLLAINV